MRRCPTFLALIPLIPLIPLLGGCLTYPCDGDVLQCEEGEALEVVRDCEATESLTAELVEMHTMDAVPADAWPIVHEGIQGGIHFDLGLRVVGLAPEHPQLQATFDVAECADAGCQTTTVVAQRTLNVDESLLEPDEDEHAMLLPDVVLLLEHVPKGGGTIAIDVLDACGREVQLLHSVAP